MNRPERYSCACCGNLTLDEKPPGTFAICPVCGWEDDEAQFRDILLSGGANASSLSQARDTYRKTGASSEEALAYSRPVLAAEVPPTDGDTGSHL